MFIFETSWEVCNKMGGIYTVLSSRAREMQREHDGRVVFVGPLLSDELPIDFDTKVPSILSNCHSTLEQIGLPYRIGHWKVPGLPAVVLIDYRPLMKDKGDFYFEMWNHFGLQSDRGYGDYDDSCVFSIAAAKVIQTLSSTINDEHTLAIYNEWQTGMGLLYSKLYTPQIKTMFITHATTVGRSIAGNNKSLYKYLSGYNGDQMANELNVYAKHTVEKLASHNADIFATVSETTAIECTQLIERSPIVLPNGFEGDLIPKGDVFCKAQKKARQKLIEVAEALTGESYPDNTKLVAISGRYEYRNKGIDLFVDALNRLRDRIEDTQQLLAFVLVPAWVATYRTDLRYKLDNPKVCHTPLQHPILTHWLHNMNSDNLLRQCHSLHLDNTEGSRVKIFFVPCYLLGNDGIFNMTYYELLMGFDTTVFPSYYEPWGYTPLESIAFGVPTITTNLAGFGRWAAPQMKDKNAVVSVIERTDDNFGESSEAIAQKLLDLCSMTQVDLNKLKKESAQFATNADWSHFYRYYLDSYQSLW